MVYDIDVIRIARQIKNNEFVRRHTHNFYHYMCVLGGKGSVEIAGTEYDSVEKCLFMVPPCVEHAVYGYKDYCAIDIKFRCDGKLTELIEVSNPVIRDLSGYEISLVTGMFHEAILTRPNRETVINARMLELLMLLGRRQTKSGIDGYGNYLNISGLPFNISHLKPALDYIEANICQPFTISKLANLCGYTATYFSSSFKDLIGIPPVKYINVKKMEIAKSLMISSGMNITQISDYLGFGSIHYFSKIFKNIIGISPRTYLARANSNLGVNLVNGYINIYPDGFEIPVQSIKE